MISEKQFAVSYTSFWSSVLPMAEEYVRHANQRLSRFATPLQSTLSAGTHGVVNELGFRLFASASRAGVSVDRLDSIAVEKSIADSLYHIRELRERSRTPVSDPDQDQIAEAHRLAVRLEVLFALRKDTQLTVFPTFPGCGWLDESEGDVLAGETLFEIKAGDRGFRSIDLRQCLIYCALNLVSQRYLIDELGLVNPRTGLMFRTSVDGLCRDLSGRSAREVLDDIIQFAMEPSWQYDRGN